MTIQEFQSTRPWGARHRLYGYPVAHLKFQSTRPWGARHSPLRVIRHWRECFNPRARGGRDLLNVQLQQSSKEFQSTRPWGARPPKHRHTVIFFHVSIHAPVGGATEYVLDVGDDWRVSIHAPVGGATRGARIQDARRAVSIHAPVGGATLTR